MDPEDDDDLEDFEDDDETTEALTGSVSTAEETSTVNDLLLDFLSSVSRLHVLLQEAEASEFKAAKVRLAAFRAAVEALPTKAVAKEPMGFKAPVKKKATKKKGSKR